MNILKFKLSTQKFRLLLLSSVLLISGIIFGIMHYYMVSDHYLNLFNQLIFIQAEGFEINYTYYLFYTFGFIILSLIFATSYVGLLLNCFLIYTRGLHLSYSLIYLFQEFSIDLQTSLLVLLPQVILEIILVITMTMICFKLSINTFLVCFKVKDNFHISRIIHYILDYFIILLIILMFIMFFRVYCI